MQRNTYLCKNTARGSSSKLIHGQGKHFRAISKFQDRIHGQKWCKKCASDSFSTEVSPAEGEGTVDAPFVAGVDAYTATLSEAGATVYYAVSVVADGDYVLTAYGADYKIGYGADLEALTYVTFDDANVISLTLTASAPLYVVVANNGDAVADVTFSISPVLE